MIKLNVKILLIAAMVCGIFAACSTAPSNNAVVVTNANNAKPANTAPVNTAPANTAPTGDKVGVAECDEYLEKLEACLAGAPEASRGMIKTNLDTMRKQWKDAAANPQTKAGLATGCKSALDTAKTTYNYCKW